MADIFGLDSNVHVGGIHVTVDKCAVGGVADDEYGR